MKNKKTKLNYTVKFHVCVKQQVHEQNMEWFQDTAKLLLKNLGARSIKVTVCENARQRTRRDAS